MRWDRPKKNLTRKLAEPMSTKRHTLWFPGEDCLDVLNAYEKGLLSEGGEHILVERDPDVVGTIKRKLSHLPLNFYFHEGELHDLVLPHELDYAHFDFCGSLSADVASWFFEELQMEEGSEVHFTLSFALRNNKFLKYLEGTFSRDEPFRSEFSYHYFDLNRSHHRISFHCTLIRSILNRWNYRSLQPLWYMDTVQSMVLYRCQHLSWRDPIVELDFRRSVPVPAKTKKARSEAARKAHETRKATRKAKQRASAIQKKKRSNAAKKAWATRRALAKT